MRHYQNAKAISIQKAEDFNIHFDKGKKTKVYWYKELEVLKFQFEISIHWQANEQCKFSPQYPLFKSSQHKQRMLSKYENVKS